jgi:hypothetical protein
LNGLRLVGLSRRSQFRNVRWLIRYLTTKLQPQRLCSIEYDKIVMMYSEWARIWKGRHLSSEYDFDAFRLVRV